MLPEFERLIQGGNLKLLDVLPGVRVRYVGESEILALDPQLASFTNVNTAGDWQLALRRLWRSLDSQP